MPLKIHLNGCKGRMGRTIHRIAAENDAEIVCSTDIGDDPGARMEACDVVIDFSIHLATRALVELAAEKGKPVVIGTTGHSPEERKAIIKLAMDIPVVWAGNYSLGVNLLNFLVEKAATILPRDYEVEIVEMHHHFKQDAPSGTAENLLDTVRRARKTAPDAIVHGRKGITGARSRDEIGVHALRGGDVVGEHTVLFAGLGERIELAHKATDRVIFAKGAIHAARWALGRPAGLYNMRDVLGLHD